MKDTTYFILFIPYQECDLCFVCVVSCDYQVIDIQRKHNVNMYEDELNNYDIQYKYKFEPISNKVISTTYTILHHFSYNSVNNLGVAYLHLPGFSIY